MKIISYLLNKLNGFRIGIDENGNAQLISYRNHPFTNTGGGGGAKRVEAFAEPGEHNNELKISQSKYDELNVGDVLVATLLVQQVVTMETIVTTSALNAKVIAAGDKFNTLLPSISYPAYCLLSKDGEIYDNEFVKDNDFYSAIINQAFSDPFTAAYDVIFGLDATLVKLERCNGSFEPTGVVSGATLAVKTVEVEGNSLTCPCLSFSDDFIPSIDTYRYKATLTDGEINFSISYQGMA